MPYKCFVPFCNTGQKDNLTKRTMFSVPKDEKLRQKWGKMIPRKDKLKPSHKVCEIHFEETDIIKGKVFIINGKEDFFPMKWKLKKGALPRIFPGCPGYLSKPVKVRKPPKDRSLTISSKARTWKEKDNICKSVTSQKNIENNEIQANIVLGIDLKKIELPSLAWSWVLNDDPEPLWGFDKEHKIVCSQNVRSSGKIYSRRSVEFNLHTKTTTFSAEDEFSDILKDFDETKLCSGFIIPQLYGVTIPASELEKVEVSRSSKCERIILKSKLCCHCKRLKYNIRRAAQRKAIRNKTETDDDSDENSLMETFCEDVVTEIEVDL